MKIRVILSLLLVAALLLVPACGGGTEEAAPTAEPTAPPTEEATEAPTEEATEAPTEEATEAPTEEPTEEPTQEPAPSAGEGTLMWAHDLAFEKAKAWKSDAVLGWIQLGTSTLAQGDELDDGAIDSATIPQVGIDVQYISPSDPDVMKCYWVRVQYVDGELLVTDSADYGRGEISATQGCSVLGSDPPIADWKIDSDEIVAEIMKKKASDDSIDLIRVQSAKQLRNNCPTSLGDLPDDHAVIFVYLAKKLGWTGSNGDRELYYDGETGEFLGMRTYDVKWGSFYTPGSCTQ